MARVSGYVATLTYDDVNYVGTYEVQNKITIIPMWLTGPSAPSPTPEDLEGWPGGGGGNMQCHSTMQ